MRRAARSPDPLLALAQPDSILLSRKFAESHGLRDGDKLPLYTPRREGHDFVVRGIIQPVGIGEIFDGRIAVIWMSSTPSSSSTAVATSTGSTS
jgi:ABC-type lipoprotein release transport system permease subunit